MPDPVRVRILGVGMGPQHVTPEVAEALRSVDYVLAADKGSDGDDDGLLALRRAIVEAYTDSSVDIVQVRDPQRDRAADLSTAGYQRAVADWHDARAAAYADVLSERGGSAAFLVLGDPSLYDSTIRVVEKIERLGVPVELDVLPGISAPQLLAARHRIV
ncbi:MAG: precorrin-6A synthase, partial [Mycobacterium sp.]|uniref:SAM-dependent methyltransferase n=1 Tax=Mycobacterium sp. TaxID=1785 RepID=UPI0028BC6AD9|nr:precorrin-6A synthase [Mycobacterium sp.]